MKFTYGKRPASPSNAPHFGDVFDLGSLPPLPTGDYGHEEGIVWPNLGNDDAGDCVWAGASSEELMWGREMGKPVLVDAASAIRNYTEVTGYDPDPTPNQIGPNGENLTDKGTDMGAAAEYRLTKGLLDAANPPQRHRISAYVQLQPQNWHQLQYAIWLFDGVGIGWEFPQEWEDALRDGSRVLGPVSNPTIAGGHYTPGVGRRRGNVSTPSWQMLLQVTPAGFEQFNDEIFAYMTKEKVLPDGKTLTGLDYAQWRAQFALVHGLGFAEAHSLSA